MLRRSILSAPSPSASPPQKRPPLRPPRSRTRRRRNKPQSAYYKQSEKEKTGDSGGERLKDLRLRRERGNQIRTECIIVFNNVGIDPQFICGGKKMNPLRFKTKLAFVCVYFSKMSPPPSKFTKNRWLSLTPVRNKNDVTNLSVTSLGSLYYISIAHSSFTFFDYT